MRAARLIKMVLLLQQRRTMSAAELAEELEVSERTVTRDVNALSEAGVPVYADRGRAGGYRLVGGYRTRLTGMGREEAEALFLSGVPGALRDLGLADSASAAALKVSAALNPEMRDAQQNVAGRFHLDAPGWWREPHSPPLLPSLAEAVWEERRVTVRYRRGHRLGQSPDESRVVVRALEPYGLVLKAGVWYLAARPVAGDGDGAREAPGHRIYRVERIAEVTVGEERFARDPGFDLPDFWARQSAAFARAVLRESVVLRLSAAGALKLPHLHGVREVVEEALSAGREDGQGLRVVTLPVESLEVAYEQLLGLGPEVEVLEPSSLRDRLARAARRMSALYGHAEPRNAQR